MNCMRLNKIEMTCAGIILHPTSLPGPYGSGEIGKEAFRFVDWLEKTGLMVSVLHMVDACSVYQSHLRATNHPSLFLISTSPTPMLSGSPALCAVSKMILHNSHAAFVSSISRLAP